eukprot:jgi/Picsp_1/5957/NSC_03313-R1_hypothetical protein CHLNCDRAFT_56574 [Chlorella variabilis]
MESADSALRPLKVRAFQLQKQATLDQESRLLRWEQSERPVLRDHALGLKETMQLLSREEEQLQQRVANLSASTVQNCPGTSTGFNVIRSRVDSCGRPLEMEALRNERERLKTALHKFEVEIANAKAEILANQKRDEVEIWETKLVAMQDTKRVYKDEINLIEVELIGREHFERMERDRQHAESTGIANLRRLQENMLQTRLKYNKAKHQYYFPSEKGFNITFGGGGIFGACKDICICEIHGNLKIESEPGSFGAKGPITPARVVVTFQAADQPQKSETQKSPSRKTSQKVKKSQSSVGKDVQSASNSPEKVSLSDAKESVLPELSTQEIFGDSLSKSPGARKPSEERQKTFNENVQTSEKSKAENAGKPPKGFAKRFVRRLGRKKDKYQGKDVDRLDPLPENEESASFKKRKSLAKKLLSRRASRASKRGPGSDIDKLTFGGNQLHLSEGSFGESIDDDILVYETTNTENSSLPDTLQPVSEERNDLAEIHEEAKGDGSLASDHSTAEDESLVDSPLTREILEKVERLGRDDSSALHTQDPRIQPPKSFRRNFRTASSGRGSWLLDAVGSESQGIFDDEASSMLDIDDPDIVDEEISEGEKAIGGMQGVYCNGRLSGFELVGEKGSKVPNLTIGKADVSATVFVKFVFEYDKDHGWRPGRKQEDKPKFHVEKLRYKIEGNNVPMPPTLIKHILRVAIPGLIQRRLLALLPPELGEYVQTSRRGFKFDADVGLVGPSLSVLDIDVGFEVLGPSKSEKDAKKQQHLFEAAREARNLLGLNLPQAQILSELFYGPSAILKPPRVASISNFIALKASYDAHPEIFKQFCSVVNAAYQVLAQSFSQVDVSDFSFLEFMEGPVSRMRKKPAKARVIMKEMDIAVNADAVVTAVHDFTKRAIEELIIKGPMPDTQATIDSMRDLIAEDLDVLHAWHVFALRELGHFKSKFRSAGGTVLLAADKGGIALGIENSHYEGPLRLRLPVASTIDHDGAVSFDLPLPSPSGSLGVFMDNFKALTVPSHLRPPSQAINWIEMLDDTEINKRMSNQISNAITMIRDVLQALEVKIKENNLYEDDNDAHKALTQPRTLVGDRLGKLIVNRLKVKVRLDEKRIGEILSGLDSHTMGSDQAFMSMRLIHALIRAAGIAFLDRESEELAMFRSKMEAWYNSLTRDALNISMCLDTGGEVVDGVFIASFRGMAEEGAVRSTSPLILTNELDLVPLGKAMRGDPPEK